MNILIKNTEKFITPETVNFHELVKNADTKLSLESQSKMIGFLTQEFTEEESQFYIASLMMYLNHHPTMDFPVNLEHVFKMIGFANKGNAMKTIKSNFTLNEDYKIVIVRTEKNLNGGRPTENIMLNVDTMKHLFLIAKTPEGKKARKYFIKIENMNHKVLQMEMEEQQLLLENTKHQNQLLELNLQNSQHKINLMTRKTNKFEKGESVYIFHSTIEENGEVMDLYKPGRTKNANMRDMAHKTTSYKGILLQIRCVDSVLLERLIHFLLNKYRLVNRREWFNCSYDIMKNCIEYAKLFLENDINFENEFLINDTEQFINTINICENIIEDKVKQESNHDIFTTLEFIPNDINNFNTFLTENCENSINSYVSHITIKNQYKIWSKTPNYGQSKKLIDYLKVNYTSSMKRFNPLVTTSKLTPHFMKIKLKECLFVFESPNNNNLVIENFLFEKCQRSPGYRVTMQDLFKEFESWYSKNFSYIIKEKIKIYLDTLFIRLRTGDESNGIDNRLGGWLGLALKSNNIPEPIKKYKPKNTKIILQKNAQTNNTIKEWPSISDIAYHMQKSTSVTSLIIKRHEQIIIDNILSVLIIKEELI